ncbi:putative G-protein coupled receptor 152 [Pelecanus crispus]|uniref:putative G-protein coupled receptor 152 n=1 Tax=Pelecanus crispus TaxID=36300 RepID=UPI003F5CFDF5
MELSNATQPPTLSLRSPGTLSWDGRLLVACAALGLPANAFTLWLTGWRLRCQGLAAFIFSLAASDFLFLANSVLQIWSVAHSHLWVLGTHLCRLHQFLYGLGYYSGLFLLAAISLDRCLLVAAPLWYRCRRPSRLPAMLCAGAWLTASGCSVPDTLLSAAEELLPGLVVCRSKRGSWEVPMRWLEVVVEGLLPFGVVVACHGAALVLARCRRGQGARPPAHFQHIVVATLSAYILLHLPFQVTQLLQLVAPSPLGHLFYVLGLAFNLSSCLNPCLYLLLGSRACHHLARLLRAVLAHLPPAALRPGPPAATTSDPPTAVTPVPPTALSPVTPTTVTPVPPTAIPSEPPTAVSPVPPTAIIPVPPTTIPSDPPTTVTPVPPTAVTPVPPTAIPSDPPTTITPEPPTALPPPAGRGVPTGSSVTLPYGVTLPPGDPAHG